MQKVIQDGTLGITHDDKFLAPPGLVLNLDCDGSDADATSSSSQSDDMFF
jgi:hypothetical protein